MRESTSENTEHGKTRYLVHKIDLGRSEVVFVSLHEGKQGLVPDDGKLRPVVREEAAKVLNHRVDAL